MRDINTEKIVELGQLIKNKVNGYFELGDNLMIEHLDDSKSVEYQVLKCRPTNNEWSAKHKHANSVEIFIVLSGDLEIKINNESVFLRTGKTITVDSNVEHSVRALAENTIFLVILVPSEKEYMHE